MSRTERRRAQRLRVDIPTQLDVVDKPAGDLHPNLAEVFERVEPAAERAGQSLSGTVRDLSTNGAFIAGEPLPLLSRVVFRIPLAGFGPIEVIGWTLWRRKKDCTIPGSRGQAVTLGQGVGVLFEAIPLDARVAIHRMVSDA